MGIGSRSFAIITEQDLSDILVKSKEKIKDFFTSETGVKWKRYYEYANPLCIALCQGAAMHYYDKTNGIKDFDIWFFYKFNKKHLPYRSRWEWDYVNKKFGCHPDFKGFEGRKVDVMIRSIKNYVNDDSVQSIYEYFQKEKTTTAKMLAQKAVVLLEPKEYLGKVIWYKNSKMM